QPRLSRVRTRGPNPRTVPDHRPAPRTRRLNHLRRGPRLDRPRASRHRSGVAAMSQHTPEPVHHAARKLMAALAPHEDTPNTGESALDALWDTAHKHTAPVMQLAQLVRDDAYPLANGAALSRL